MLFSKKVHSNEMSYFLYKLMILYKYRFKIIKKWIFILRS